jgi:hypothetical protein
MIDDSLMNNIKYTNFVFYGMATKTLSISEEAYNN